MWDPSISIISFAISRIYIYMGITIMIGGVLGGIVNVIIFLSLRIYRQSSSAFYLTVVSIINIGQLLSGLLTRVLINVVGIDWTTTSFAYCIMRNYFFQACAIISPVCLCLATIDQYLATSDRPQWQRWNSIKAASCLSACTIVFWLIYGISYIMNYRLVVSITTGQTSCVIIDPIFNTYYNNFHVPVLMCSIPLCITIIFGLLAYRNVRQLSHRAVPIVRRRHEVQLTAMVLVQVVFNLFATTPCFIVLTFAANTTITQDPLVAIKVRLAIAITTCFYYLYYAIPFYIYICVSERFRKQLHYVLIGNHQNRWRRVTGNAVAPQGQSEHMNGTQNVTIEAIQLS